MTSGGYWKCEKCDARVKNDKWNTIKSGWFFTRDGLAYCPQHIPRWVKEWRRRQARGQEVRKWNR